MKKLLSVVLAGIAIVASNAASLGCSWFVFDEPEAPKSMMD